MENSLIFVEIARELLSCVRGDDIYDVEYTVDEDGNK